MRIFVYGTLMEPHIQKRVLGKEKEVNEFTLHGYKLSDDKVYGAYPTIEKDNNGTVKGVIFPVDEQEISLLDSYEGDEYTKLTLDDDLFCYIKKQPEKELRTLLDKFGGTLGKRLDR